MISREQRRSVDHDHQTSSMTSSQLDSERLFSSWPRRLLPWEAARVRRSLATNRARTGPRVEGSAFPAADVVHTDYRGKFDFQNRLVQTLPVTLVRAELYNPWLTNSTLLSVSYLDNISGSIRMPRGIAKKTHCSSPLSSTYHNLNLTQAVPLG